MHDFWFYYLLIGIVLTGYERFLIMVGQMKDANYGFLFTLVCTIFSIILYPVLMLLMIQKRFRR